MEAVERLHAIRAAKRDAPSMPFPPTKSACLTTSGDVAYSPKSHAAVLHACRAAKQQTRMLLVAAQPETLVRRYTAPLRPAVSEA